jgi:N-methylhydantoinase B
MRQLDHHLAVDDADRILCRTCGHVLGSAERNFKEGAVMKERPIQDANPLIVDPALFIDDEVVFRQYFCPGCATLLENEVVLASTPPIWDKQLAPNAREPSTATQDAEAASRA